MASYVGRIYFLSSPNAVFISLYKIFQNSGF